MRRSAFVAPLMLVAGLAARADDPRPRFERRWVYAMANLMVDAEADRVVALAGRAGGSGYNGLVLADYKLNLLDRVQPNYFRNVARLKAACDRAGVEIIPAIFPIGYSNGLLAHDPNLAEGLPVEDAPFLVGGGEARLAVDPGVRLRGGDMEEARGDAVAGFDYQDDPGTATLVDRAERHAGAQSLRIGATRGNARLIRAVRLRPHGCYRLTAWVKTRAWSRPGDFRLLALGRDGRALSFAEGGVARDQDWKQVEVVFNSLDSADVNLYAGVWGGGTGSLWIDDFAIEEVGLVNVLRRPGCPLVVRSADGATTFEEGRDFAPVADPKLGRVPYAGEYAFGHEPARLEIPSGSRIRDGDRLLVSWYHPVVTVGGQVMCCVSEPAVDQILADQARRVAELFRPRAVFLSHDEIRVMNWCRACQDRALTPGALLADNVRRCRAILDGTMPGAEVLIWSDMFDPHHNAVARYYLVNGPLAGSWEGLDPKMTIANWNEGHAEASLRFFADRGHRQLIAGYYDGDDLANYRRWDAASRAVPRADGFMYTTWERKFGLLDDYGAALRK